MAQNIDPDGATAGKTRGTLDGTLMMLFDELKRGIHIYIYIYMYDRIICMYI